MLKLVADMGGGVMFPDGVNMRLIHDLLLDSGEKI